MVDVSHAALARMSAWELTADHDRRLKDGIDGSVGGWCAAACAEGMELSSRTVSGALLPTAPVSGAGKAD